MLTTQDSTKTTSLSHASTSAPGLPSADSPAPLVQPLSMDGLRPEWKATLDRIPGAGLKGAGFPRNVLGVMMHNPDTFGPFLDYWVTSKSALSLSVREQEIIILRMGWLYGCDYVWAHHVPVATEFGLTTAEIDALETEGAAGLSTARERALVLATDELISHRTLRGPVAARLRPLLSERELVDVVALVAQYVFFALTNNAFRVEIEPTLDARLSRP